VLRHNLKVWRQAGVNDLRSLARHGRHAPLWCQRIWVDPASFESIIVGYHFDVSGRVVGGDWDTAGHPIESSPQFVHTRLRYVTGLPWEETGAYDYLLGMIEQQRRAVDGCLTLDDVIRRYEELDRLYEVVERDRYLLPQHDLPGASFRERDGVYAHLGRDGRPIFGCKGHHRLAIARILELPMIPAQLGMVHEDLVPGWKHRYGHASVTRVADAGGAPVRYG
jgi:hypothetical protein